MKTLVCLLTGFASMSIMGGSFPADLEVQQNTAVETGIQQEYHYDDGQHYEYHNENEYNYCNGTGSAHHAEENHYEHNGHASGHGQHRNHHN